MKTIFTGIAFFFLTSVGFAQLDTAMVRTIGGDRNEEANDVIETEDGGYLLFGTTGSADESSSKMYLVKLSEALDFEWSRVYGENNLNSGVSVLSDENGNFYLIGHTLNLFSGYDVLVSKIDSDGNLIWSEVFGGTDWDFANDATQLLDGNLLIVGETWSFGGENQIYVLKVSSDGDLIWESSYGNEGVDVGYSVSQIPNSSNEFYIAGTSQLDDQTRSFLALINSDSGALIWETNESENSSFEQFILDSHSLQDSSIVISGYYSDENRDKRLIKKYSYEGELLWERQMDDIGNMQLRGVTEALNGHLLFAGKSDVYGSGGLSMYLMRTNNAGGYADAAAFGGELDEVGNAILVDSQGRTVFVGLSNSYSQSQDDFYLVRIPNTMLVSEYILDRAEYQDDFATVITESIGIVQEVKVFPNPAEKILTIHHGSNEKESIAITNIQGKQIFSSTLKPIQSQLSIEFLEAGVYFLRFKSPKFKGQTIKIMKR